MDYLKLTFLDCYRYREVLYNMLSRDLKLKYKRTILGYFWSLLNPILQLAVLTAVFSHIVRLDIKNYTLFLFSGLLAWNFFNTAVMSASGALLENEGFIKKIYMPKVLFPLVKVCLGGVDFVFAVVALTLIGVVMGFPFRSTSLLLPLPMLLLFIFSLGLGLFFSVATVYFRDVQYLLGVFFQLLYFATPIFYPLASLPEKHQWVAWLNPLYPLVTLFQQLIYEGKIPSSVDWATAATLAMASLVLGLGTLIRCEEDLVFRM